MKIRSTEEIARKYVEVTPARSASYADGIANPKADWKASTQAAASTYAQGVQQALANKAFEKGVGRASTEKWKRKATEVGAARWGPGVAAAQEDYAAGFGPYQGVIAGLTLPPRGARGDPRNLDRVTRIATALHAKKVAG